MRKKREKNEDRKLGKMGNKTVQKESKKEVLNEVKRVLVQIMIQSDFMVSCLVEGLCLRQMLLSC